MSSRLAATQEPTKLVSKFKAKDTAWVSAKKPRKGSKTPRIVNLPSNQQTEPITLKVDIQAMAPTYREVEKAAAADYWTPATDPRQYDLRDASAEPVTKNVPHITTQKTDDYL